MTAAKRLGTDRSEKRTALIDAAEALLVEEGYGAVTSRRVAERAGLKHQLIFYYFNALDDLLLEVLRRLSERSFERLDAAFAEARPLSALWALSTELASTPFGGEFIALASRNRAIGEEIGTFVRRYREAVIEGLTRHFAARGGGGLAPGVLAVLVATVSSGLAFERGLGLTLGHGETEALVRRLIDQLEADQPVRIA